jgi:hypothetical protein
MNNNNNNTDVIGIDYLVWAMYQVVLVEQKDLPVPDPSDPWRLSHVCRWVADRGRFDKIEMLNLVEFASLLGAECRLLAAQNGGQTRALYVSRIAELTPGNRTQVKKRLGEWIFSMCRTRALSELCWGSQLEERPVLEVLTGRKTRVDWLTRVLWAAEHDLRFWFVFQGYTVGSADFCARYPYAAPAVYQSVNRFRRLERAENAAFMQCMFGDF